MKVLYQSKSSHSQTCHIGGSTVTECVRAKVKVKVAVKTGWEGGGLSEINIGAVSGG